MRETHFIKAGHAQPFISFLKSKNIPLKELADQAGLPLDAALEGEGVIGERSLWRFIDLAAQKHRLDFLGYQCAVASPVVSDGKLGSMPLENASSLKHLLEQFFRYVMKESTGCAYELVPGETHSLLQRTPTFRDELASWQAEQYMIQVFIQIVRISTGPNWLPSEVGVNSISSPQPLPDEWRYTRFIWGRTHTQLKIPNAVLNLPPLADFQNLDRSKRFGSLDRPEELSVRSLVKRQVLTGCPGLEAAAHELGISTATLKRRFYEMGLSYSTLVEQSRFKLAHDMLKNENIPLRQIAHDLGYRHHANFDRAFKRWTDVSPRHYRLALQKSTI